MFEPGGQVALRHGNRWETVAFLGMSEERLAIMAHRNPADHLQETPGGEPTALIRRADGTELLVLLAELKPLEAAAHPAEDVPSGLHHPQPIA